MPIKVECGGTITDRDQVDFNSSCLDLIEDAQRGMSWQKTPTLYGICPISPGGIVHLDTPTIQFTDLIHLTPEEIISLLEEETWTCEPIYQRCPLALKPDPEC